MEQARRAEADPDVREVIIDPTNALLERLTETIQRMAMNTVPQAPRIKLHPPTFNGQGDVNQFIRHFIDVADASQWDEGITMLHLREALREQARDCGRADNVAGITQALRMRFGMSTAEASSRLATVKRDPKMSLQEYAGQVEKLVNLTHPELPRAYKVEMTLRTFKATLGHVGLQRHLLVAPVFSIEDAIQIGNDFLQIGAITNPIVGRQGVSYMEAEDTEHHSVQPVTHPPDPQTQMMKAISLMMDKIGKLEEQIQAANQSKAPAPTQAPQQPRKPLTCWKCGLPGHRQANCPHGPVITPAGNATSPRQ